MGQTARLSSSFRTPRGMTARASAWHTMFQHQNGFFERFHTACGDKVRMAGDWLSADVDSQASSLDPSGEASGEAFGLEWERAIFLDVADTVPEDSEGRARSLWSGSRTVEDYSAVGDATKCMETQRACVHSDDRVTFSAITIPDASGGQSVSNLFRLEQQGELRVGDNGLIHVEWSCVATCTKSTIWGVSGMIERAVLKRAVAAHEVWMLAAQLELERISRGPPAPPTSQASSNSLVDLPSDFDQPSAVRLAHVRRVLAGTEKLQGVLRAAARSVHRSADHVDKGSDTEGVFHRLDVESGAALPNASARTLPSRSFNRGGPGKCFLFGMFVVALVGVLWYFSVSYTPSGGSSALARISEGVESAPDPATVR